MQPGRRFPAGLWKGGAGDDVRMSTMTQTPQSAPPGWWSRRSRRGKTATAGAGLVVALMVFSTVAPRRGEPTPPSAFVAPASTATAVAPVAAAPTAGPTITPAAPSVGAAPTPTLTPEPTRTRTPERTKTRRPPRATPQPTPRPTPKPTEKPRQGGGGGFYKPPGWRGGDVNCDDFNTHRQAQDFFKGTGGSRNNDPYGLDSDGDGIACETLP